MSLNRETRTARAAARSARAERRGRASRSIYPARAMPCLKPSASTCGAARRIHQVGAHGAGRAGVGRDDLHARAAPAAAAASTDVASRQPATRPRSASAGDGAHGGRGDEAEHAVAATRACQVEVRGAPDAAVHVLAAADLDGREEAGYRARRRHGSATLASGAPSEPNATRRPEPRSTATMLEPAVEARARARRPASAGRAARCAPRDAREQGGARQRARPGVAALSAGAASGENAPSETRLARSNALRSALGRRSGSHLAVPAHALLAAPRVLAARQPRGDDRAGGRADQLLRAAEVLTASPLRRRRGSPTSRPRRGSRQRRARARWPPRQCATLPRPRPE